MRVIVHAIGRVKAGSEAEIAGRYTTRLSKAAPAIGVTFAGVVEKPESRARSAAERKRDEAERLLEAIGSDPFVLLDEGGNNLTSRELSEAIASYRDTGERSLAFVVGGPDGVDQELKARAARTVSFGAQTWPHQLVRVMLVEQLYRCVTILAGHPYHRD